MKQFVFSLLLALAFISNQGFADEFDDLARQLAPAIIKTLPDEATWFDNISKPIEDKPQEEKPSLAVILPDASLLPIAPELAKAWNDRLTGALLKTLGNRVDVISHAGLRSLINQLGNYAPEDEINALMNSAKVDILIEPIYHLQAQIINVIWRALDSKHGRLLAQTQSFSQSTANVNLAQETVIAYQNANSIISKKLLGGLDRPPKAICNAGLIHEESQTRPAFARELADTIMTEMQYKGFDAITTDKLPQFLSNCYDVEDGLRLSGNYWVTKDHINLTAKLSDYEGRGASYRVAINLATIPANLEVLPSSKTHLGWSKPISGALGLTLTSLKGDNPIYKVGEQLFLKMSLDEAAFIHCYYVDSKGSVIKIFPNQRHPSAQFRSGDKLIWPTAENMGFRFTLNNNSLGQEELRCFATNQDITQRLPRPLQQLSFDPLPPRLAKKLPSFYNGQKDVKIDESNIVISVVGK